MRLLRRIYRLLAGQCLLCGTRLTDLELTMGYHYCMICETRLDS